MARHISIEHGEGGEMTHELIRDLFVKYFGHAEEAKFDAAVLDLPGSRIAFTTDTFTVKPPFFSGGNIGKLAVAGTVNDLAVSGAEPLYLSAGFVLEEGLSFDDLERIVASMAEEASKTGVRIITGDTKVVEKGSADKIFINTSGVGVVHPGWELHPEDIEEGDVVIVNGTIGDHGVAILAARGELGVATDLPTDSTSLYPLIRAVRDAGVRIRVMRDPTRGGLATTLVEITEDFGVIVELDQEAIPLKPEVEGACEILGLDPLFLANEGKVVFIVPEADAEKALAAMRAREEGRDATIIGRVVGRSEEGKLLLRSPVGSRRRIFRLLGMQLPRIC
ncbi:hydrogenase expression/formation protein HypE [Brockia lithotrophica]|uniref:Hydrogenase maturation carbamoyl dehydratase HypE n=1 Tax=Brockia lithotrophica TaxID=933949 RepID=A0A660L9C7_9BACL|nr:hydrogenase expression/formation protein HypE [Brockia lithotrophica]RKQ88533.1 hydrogenase maturation carbamoyl dehydratase HypE [Brockia lithotrophica]